MTNPFDTALENTAAAFTTTFAETIVYKPLVGDERSIEAIVTRHPTAQLPAAPHGYGPEASIDVENNAATGISTSEVDCGKDLVSFPRRIDGAARDWRIPTIISQDAGRVCYECR